MPGFLLKTAALAVGAALGLAAYPDAAAAACERRMAAKGFPNRTETVAGLSAMRLWVEAVTEKHGEAYAMWHNAGSAELRCSIVYEPDFMTCVALGRPCRMHMAESEEVPADARKR